MTRTSAHFAALKVTWKRRRLLWRAFIARHQLKPVSDHTNQIRTDDILAFSTVRNEAIRLPYFLSHYRKLGIKHFLIVDNNSTDGTVDLLRAQPDVSVWHTIYGYKSSRFGVDWLNWLQWRYGDGHWTLTVDADELLIYPHYVTRPLRALTEWLDCQQRLSFGALMLDLYPRGRVSEHPYKPGDNPLTHLHWFDAGNYSYRRQEALENLWGQGGVRARMFFASEPRRAPTLTKVPLIKWKKSYAYVSSTHSALPRCLNHVYDQQGGELTSGVLLHTKFLNTIVTKSEEERKRRQHFANSALYDDYYAELMDDPTLWSTQSTHYTGWRQLEAMGLMSRGGWI